MVRWERLKTLSNRLLCFATSRKRIFGSGWHERVSGAILIEAVGGIQSEVFEVS